MAWTTFSVLAWCPTCPGEPHMRFEQPSRDNLASARLWAQTHADRHGHEVSMEQGRIDIVRPRRRREVTPDE